VLGLLPGGAPLVIASSIPGPMLTRCYGLRLQGDRTPPPAAE
jgi:hypothetical protein